MHVKWDITLHCTPSLSVFGALLLRQPFILSNYLLLIFHMPSVCIPAEWIYFFYCFPLYGPFKCAGMLMCLCLLTSLNSLYAQHNCQNKTDPDCDERQKTGELRHDRGGVCFKESLIRDTCGEVLHFILLGLLLFFPPLTCFLSGKVDPSWANLEHVKALNATRGHSHMARHGQAHPRASTFWCMCQVWASFSYVTHISSSSGPMYHGDISSKLQLCLNWLVFERIICVKTLLN